MKKTLVITLFFIVFFLIYFLQTNFFSWYNISGIKPNLFIIFLLSIGLFSGKNLGLTFGIIFGILLDFFIGKRIGINAIILGIAGCIGGILDKSFSKESRITFMLMTFIVTTLCEIVGFILQILLLSAQVAFTEFMNILLIEAIFNAFIVVILYPLIQKSGEKTEEVFTEHKSLIKYF